MSNIFSRIKLTYLFTNRYLSLARLVLIQLLLMLRPGWNKVEIKLHQRCFNVVHRRCINVVQCWKSDVGFCFIFNVGSTLFQRRSTTLKQRWSDVEMLAGYARYCNLISTLFFLHITYFLSLFGFFVMIWKRRVVDLFILFTEIVTENSQVIFFFLLKHYNGVQIFQLPLLWKMNLVNKYFMKILLLYLQIYQI